VNQPKPRPHTRYRHSSPTGRTASQRGLAAAALQFLRIVVGQLVAYLLHDWLG